MNVNEDSNSFLMINRYGQHFMIFVCDIYILYTVHANFVIETADMSAHGVGGTYSYSTVFTLKAVSKTHSFDPHRVRYSAL